MDNGGSEVLSYKVRFEDQAGTLTSVDVDAGDVWGPRELLVSGLSEGELYTFYVQAVNAYGTSGASPALTVVTALRSGRISLRETNPPLASTEEEICLHGTRKNVPLYLRSFTTVVGFGVLKAWHGQLVPMVVGINRFHPRPMLVVIRLEDATKTGKNGLMPMTSANR